MLISVRVPILPTRQQPLIWKFSKDGDLARRLRWEPAALDAIRAAVCHCVAHMAADLATCTMTYT